MAGSYGQSLSSELQFGHTHNDTATAPAFKVGFGSQSKKLTVSTTSPVIPQLQTYQRASIGDASGQ